MKDKNGTVLGRFAGLALIPVPSYAVLRDGGAYYYYESGQLFGVGTPSWKTNTCTGTAYLSTTSAAAVPIYAALVGGSFRRSTGRPRRPSDRRRRGSSTG